VFTVGRRRDHELHESHESIAIGVEESNGERRSGFSLLFPPIRPGAPGFE